MATLAQLSILDDDADQVAGDWELGWDSYQGFLPEIYRGIEEYFLGFDNQEASGTFKNAINDVIDKYGFDEDKAFHLLTATRVCYNDGTLKELWVDDDVSWSSFSAIESGDDSPTFNLSNSESGLDVFVGRQQVCMLDMPLHRMSKAAKRAQAQCSIVQST